MLTLRAVRREHLWKILIFRSGITNRYPADTDILMHYTIQYNVEVGINNTLRRVNRHLNLTSHSEDVIIFDSHFSSSLKPNKLRATTILILSDFRNFFPKAH